MFEYEKTKEQIKALGNVIQLTTDEKEAQLLLELQQTLISICTTIKSDNM